MVGLEQKYSQNDLKIPKRYFCQKFLNLAFLALKNGFSVQTASSHDDTCCAFDIRGAEKCENARKRAKKGETLGLLKL